MAAFHHVHVHCILSAMDVAPEVYVSVLGIKVFNFGHYHDAVTNSKYGVTFQFRKTI